MDILFCGMHICMHNCKSELFCNLYRYRKIAGDVCYGGVSAQYLPPSDCGT